MQADHEADPRPWAARRDGAPHADEPDGGSLEQVDPTQGPDDGLGFALGLRITRAGFREPESAGPPPQPNRAEDQREEPHEIDHGEQWNEAAGAARCDQ